MSADAMPARILARGFAAWQAGDHARAHTIFRDACTNYPLHADAWRGLGSVEW